MQDMTMDVNEYSALCAIVLMFGDAKGSFYEKGCFFS
jgi:hypothetical protein